MFFEDCVFYDFGEIGSVFLMRQCCECCDVCEYQLWLMECIDEVFVEWCVDVGFVVDRGVGYGEGGCWQLYEWNVVYL